MSRVPTPSVPFAERLVMFLRYPLLKGLAEKYCDSLPLREPTRGELEEKLRRELRKDDLEKVARMTDDMLKMCAQEMNKSIVITGSVVAPTGR